MGKGFFTPTWLLMRQFFAYEHVCCARGGNASLLKFIIIESLATAAGINRVPKVERVCQFLGGWCLVRSVRFANSRMWNTVRPTASHDWWRLTSCVINFVHVCPCPLDGQDGSNKISIFHLHHRCGRRCPVLGGNEKGTYPTAERSSLPRRRRTLTILYRFGA